MYENDLDEQDVTKDMVSMTTDTSPKCDTDDDNSENEYDDHDIESSQRYAYTHCTDC